MSTRRASSRVSKPSGRGLPSSESPQAIPAKPKPKPKQKVVPPKPKKTASSSSSPSSSSSKSSRTRKSSATSATSPSPEPMTKMLDDDSEYEPRVYEIEDEERREQEEQEEQDEEQEEDGSEEERPAKRRKAAKEPAPPAEITYHINFFATSDMSKLGKKPQPKGSSILKLLDNITFDRFEQKLLAKFCKLAKIAVPPEDDELDIKFQVPRQVVNYVSLDDEDAYKHMIASALRGQNPSANIAISYLEDKTASKSDVEEEKAAGKKKAGKKSKVPSENDISPVNAEINAKIALLRTKYTCHDNDGSDFCWPSPEDGKHVALGHPHFNMWAAAWAHGNGDEETPPNHAIFSGHGNSGLASKSLLQRRAAGAATNQASTATGPTIHNNFTIPDGLLDLFRPTATAVPQPAPAPAPLTQTHEPQLMLLPRGMNVGPQMPIATFCNITNLDDAIAEKFATNGYRTTAAFRFIELKDLPLIQFLPGEIAELREAVREWAVAT
ncbi:hypothetical protein K438DRAFT_1845453 [Mycena galopus ATCC 62051]|nr:hypothetical protein K438DRAFT_1845453 [Mycena galopus ATCC 62051]